MPTTDQTLAFSRVLTPTAVKQCIGFMIGSALFAVGAGIAIWGNADQGTLANVLYFIGSWFFTAAGMVQLVLSGAVTVPVDFAPGKMFRAEWLAASTQSVGTVLFNVSTGAALMSHTIAAEKDYMWNPDAAGSVAFLLGGVFVLIAFVRVDRFWDPGKVDWWSGQINFAGCVAFGVAAVAAFITAAGSSLDPSVANWGTLIGAICFFLSSGVSLPGALRASASS